MSEDKRITEILNLINAPAFSVTGGSITQCNDAAQRLLFTIETPIATLLQKNQDDYLQFDQGCLYITLAHNEQLYSASVVRMENSDIFILEEESDRIGLNTLSLTAANMRQPLSSMIAAVGNLTSSLEQNEDPKIRTQIQHMNRNLCRMHRMLCNMSDALQYSNGTSSHMTCQNIVSVVETIFQKAQQLCAESNIQFEYHIPKEDILCSIDENLLERGIYNVISNAIKFSNEGSVIQAELVHRNNRIYISIRDQGSGIPPSIMHNVFNRYQRLPGLDDGRSGLGLGLVLVRCAARIHGGTVLVDQPDQIGTRVTLSFPVRQRSNPLLRSSVTRIDYASGWDHSLLELSDVLPAKLY